MTLNRIDLADIHEPVALAASIHTLIDATDGSVPVEQIAKDLDIKEIAYGQYDGFAGMLLTNRARSSGIIAADNSLGIGRTRFTVAHELGHFLLERHVFSTDGGFTCTADDMRKRSRAKAEFRQEVEANEFAISLLAPPIKFVDVCKDRPDLGSLRRLSKQLQVSLEAIARQFAQLSQKRLAIMFHRNGIVRYSVTSGTFPGYLVARGKLVRSVVPSFVDQVSLLEKGDPKDWFDGPPMADLSVQWLRQAGGYGMILLVLED